MASTAGVSYTYDGDGLRVKKSNGTLYWYGMGGQLLAESDTNGTIISEYIFFGGMRIARRDVSTGNVYYFLADRLGNARVLTNSTGSVVEESDYYPFGQERVVTGSGGANKFKYTGHERDTESNLDHTLYRQLSSAQARWLSPDPKRGSPTNPQSWNRFSYGGNDPCNRIDPDGAEAEIINIRIIYGFPYPPNMYRGLWWLEFMIHRLNAQGRSGHLRTDNYDEDPLPDIVDDFTTPILTPILAKRLDTFYGSDCEKALSDVLGTKYNKTRFYQTFQSLQLDNLALLTSFGQKIGAARF